jgi:hypothetical protein
MSTSVPFPTAPRKYPEQYFFLSERHQAKALGLVTLVNQPVQGFFSAKVVLEKSLLPTLHGKACLR